MSIISIKKVAKVSLGQLMAMTGLMRQMNRYRAPVVTFHRVNNRNSANGLTCDVRTFQKFCRFFKNHFEVIPLENLASKLQRGESLDRVLAITFDDGYADCSEVAAPILRSFGLPATFYVTTGFMDTDYIPWWDQKAGVKERWMTWAQVVSLHRDGFEIGSHTRTHVDLGLVNGEQAWEEIAGSKRDLEERLNASVSAFAYPYGGPSHITEEKMLLIKKAGFTSCCSSYGGVNNTMTDVWSIHRIPIGRWHCSPFEFGFELSTGRTRVRDYDQQI